MVNRSPRGRELTRARSRGKAGATGALVLGGDYRGLGVVRSLGRRGIPVWVVTDEHTVAATSRYATRRIAGPAPEQKEFGDFLLDLGRRHDLSGWTIFPTGDTAAAVVSQQFQKLAEAYFLTVPPWEVMRWAYDKRFTHQLANRVGVDHPRTHYPSNREDVAAADYSFPVILKPAVKERPTDFTRSKAWRVENRQQLLAAYDLACTMVDPSIVMIQDLIPGGGDTQVSYAALCEDGQPIASLTARRLRQYPMDFGRFSTFVEVVELPEVEELATRLVREIRYTGLIEVEFKYDRRESCYKLLDLNPRVWGWHTLAQRAGIDFPYLAWQMVLGQRITPVRARAGTRWVRLLTDVLAAGQEIRRRQLSPIDYVRSLRGPLEFAMYAADDPMPAILDVPLQFLRLWQRAAT